MPRNPSNLIRKFFTKKDESDINREVANEVWSVEVGSETSYCWPFGINSNTHPHVADFYSLDHTQRAVNCVNGCKGINPKAVPDVINHLKRLIAYYAPKETDLKALEKIDDARNALARLVLE